MKSSKSTLDALVPAILVILLGSAALGWIMNLQNLLQYEVSTNKFLVSLAGVFVFPIGIFTGWLW